MTKKTQQSILILSVVIVIIVLCAFMIRPCSEQYEDVKSLSGTKWTAEKIANEDQKGDGDDGDDGDDDKSFTNRVTMKFISGDQASFSIRVFSTTDPKKVLFRQRVLLSYTYDPNSKKGSATGGQNVSHPFRVNDKNQLELLSDDEKTVQMVLTKKD